MIYIFTGLTKWFVRRSLIDKNFLFQVHGCCRSKWDSAHHMNTKGQKRQFTITFEMEINHNRTCQKIKSHRKNTLYQGTLVHSACQCYHGEERRLIPRLSPRFLKTCDAKLRVGRSQLFSILRDRQHFVYYKVKVGATQPNALHR